MWLSANITNPKKEGRMAQQHENRISLSWNIHPAAKRKEILKAPASQCRSGGLWRPLVEARLPAVLTDNSFCYFYRLSLTKPVLSVMVSQLCL